LRGEGDPLLDIVPEDALREALEDEPKRRGRRRGRRLRPPTRGELARVVAEAVALYYGHPDGFPDFVYELLESRGFSPRRVTVKRIWATYEELVRRGVVGDRLGVVEG